MNKSLFCKVGDVQCKQFHFFCSDFKHPLLESSETWKKTQKKSFFPLPPAPSPEYPQDPDPDPQKKMRIRNPGLPRWSEGSRTPSATSTSLTMGSRASTIYIHKNEHSKHVSWKRFLKRKRSGWVPRWSEGSRTPSATSPSSTMGRTASTIYIHKNEHSKHVSWKRFSKRKRSEWVPRWSDRSWNMFQMFIFMNINGTCCTLLGWACRGRWGCPRALRSPWDPSWSFSFQKSFMIHNMFQMFIFMNIIILALLPMVSLSRSLRVS